MLRTGKFSIDLEAIPDEIYFSKIPHKGRQNKADREEAKKIIERSLKQM